MSMQPSGDGLVKRTGAISNYQVKRAAASFVFTESDQTKLGVIAVAAGLAGLGGQAVATASHAASAEEDADYVEFDLDGQPVKGWVWRSPFKNGDDVEVVGEVCGSFLDAAAIARPADRTIALYPHCSRGRGRHWKNAVRWWFLGGSAFVSFIWILAFFTGPLDHFISDMGYPMLWASFSAYVFFALMTFSLARKWMPFVRVAEKVFKALGWADPGNVDLVKSSKAQRRPDDPGEFGTFYFRYWAVAEK